MAGVVVEKTAIETIISDKKALDAAARPAGRPGTSPLSRGFNLNSPAPPKHSGAVTNLNVEAKPEDVAELKRALSHARTEV